MIDGLKPYAEMKESGLPWAARIPSHWETTRGKNLFQKVQRPTRANDETVTCFRDGVVTLRKNRRTQGFTEALKEIGYQGIRKGDLVIHAMDAFAGATGVSDSDGKGTPVYAVCLPRGGANPHYFAHIVREMARTEWITALATGIRERSTDFRFDTFANQMLPLPPPEEQTAIVRFLDHADRRIKRYIQAKRKLIALLNEQKQAIIHQAVTRGLDPNVTLKPSGVEWLGHVPEHWEVVRCKYLFREVDQRSQAGEETHLSMSQRLGLVPSHLVDNRTLVSESYAGGKLCQVGDLVLNRLKAHLGVFALSEHSGVISPDYTVFRAVGGEDVRFFETVLRSTGCRKELRIRAKGIVEGLWRLYTDDFYDIFLPVPPLEERERLVQNLHSVTQEVAAVIDQAEREITLLREYRTRLIADVVTGKLDVRETAAAISDEPSTRKSASPTKTPNKHFYRSVLAAEIVARHQGTKRFGRIKLQKALVLAEYHLQLTEIQSELVRAAAGPFDNRMIRSVESQMRKQKWFDTVKTDDSGTEYPPLEKVGGHRVYFDRYWSDKQAAFDRLLRLLLPMKTIQAEIVATLYTAWNDFLIDGEPFDDERLVDEVLTNWHSKKERIPRDRWKQAVQWMREKQLIPTGFGTHSASATESGC